MKGEADKKPLWCDVVIHTTSPEIERLRAATCAASGEVNELTGQMQTVSGKETRAEAQGKWSEAVRQGKKWLELLEIRNRLEVEANEYSLQFMRLRWETAVAARTQEAEPEEAKAKEAKQEPQNGPRDA